jgi:large subunit ribosomal protein L6
MSRIGKAPVVIPQGVTVDLAGGILTTKGKLGTLTLAVSNDVDAVIKDGRVTVAPKNETKRARMAWGTTRALVSNMVDGVTKGYTVNLDINGVGYRAAVQGKDLVLQLGYSHDVTFPIPSDIKIACEKPTAIAVTGADKQRVGQIAAVIRSFRGPEPYKGKGIKYATETVRRKEGKKK